MQKSKNKKEKARAAAQKVLLIMKLGFIMSKTNGRKPTQRLFDLKRALRSNAIRLLAGSYNVRFHQNRPNVYSNKHNGRKPTQRLFDLKRALQA